MKPRPPTDPVSRYDFVDMRPHKKSRWRSIAATLAGRPRNGSDEACCRDAHGKSPGGGCVHMEKTCASMYSTAATRSVASAPCRPRETPFTIQQPPGSLDANAGHGPGVPRTLGGTLAEPGRTMTPHRRWPCSC